MYNHTTYLAAATAGHLDDERRDESAISDLTGHELEEEDYPVVDYESDLQTAMSTTVR
uniref:Uncharacterized protein n=1 Tax=Oryza sativa subsp. japonica TaxID=39947 RepID=Q6KAE7_ORYSJ|nr:unknown protein [Oryza sativa Japonica Group]